MAVSVSWDDLQWEQTGPDDDPGERLSGRSSGTGRFAPALTMLGVPMHVEAYRVRRDDETSAQDADGPWSAQTLAAIGAIDSGDGPRMTFEYEGSEYVVVAYPYCT